LAVVNVREKKKLTSERAPLINKWKTPGCCALYVSDSQLPLI
jgi:hypothetical protein